MTIIALAVEKGTARGGNALAHARDIDEREVVQWREGVTGEAARTKGTGRGAVPMTAKGSAIVTMTTSDHGPLSEREVNVVMIERAEIRAHENGT